MKTTELHLPLTNLKRWPTLKARFDGKLVRIFSSQWLAYWRPGGHGYTDKITDAGVFSFEEAFKRTHHCGPEKGIVYEIAEPDFVI